MLLRTFEVGTQQNLVGFLINYKKNKYFDRETPPISFRAVKVVCLINAELAASGNLDLVRVDEGADDVQTDDKGQSERSFLRLARRDWSYLYCGARSVTSDFEE